MKRETHTGMASFASKAPRATEERPFVRPDAWDDIVALDENPRPYSFRVPDGYRTTKKSERLTRADEKELANLIQAGIAARADQDEGRHTAAETREIRRKIEAGDNARERLCLGNIALIPFVLRRIYGLIPNQNLPSSWGLNTNDLMQHAFLGLMQAADTYDPSRGAKFATHAIPTIKREIGRDLDNNSQNIRVPVHNMEAFRALRKRQDQLTVTLGREATA